MKIGMCSGRYGSEGDPLGLRAASMLQEAGYDYLEVNITQFTQMDDAMFDAACALAAQSVLPVEAGNCLFPGSISLYGDRAPILEWVKKAVGRASRLGLKAMVFGSGRARTCPEGMDHAQAFAILADVLRDAAEIAAEKAITLVVEPLNRSETDMICTVGEGARLVRAANHPHARLLVDYFHYCRENDALACEDIPLLAHAHCAEPEKRYCHNVMDDAFHTFLQTLRNGGYDGRISIEASGEYHEGDFLAFPALMKEFR